jgi:hypothetical protein
MATILSGAPDLRWSAVRGKRAPNERLEFAARQISAADMFAAACADALSVAQPAIAAPRQAIMQFQVKTSLMERGRTTQKPGLLTLDLRRYLWMARVIAKVPQRVRVRLKTNHAARLYTTRRVLEARQQAGVSWPGDLPQENCIRVALIGKVA